MQRLLHHVLQASRLLQIVCIFGIDYFKENLLDVSLVGLVLNDLAKLDAIDFRGYESLHFIEQILLLA